MQVPNVFTVSDVHAGLAKGISPTELVCQKWESVLDSLKGGRWVEASATMRGSTNCAYCITYRVRPEPRNPNLGRTEPRHCSKFCPVVVETGVTNCRGTPYEKLRKMWSCDKVGRDEEAQKEAIELVTEIVEWLHCFRKGENQCQL